MGSQGEEEGGEETLKPRAQSAMSPPPREWGGNRCRGRLARRSALTWRASVCTWRRHRWKWTKEKLLPTGPEGPAAVGVLCSVEVRAQVGGGDEWAWGKGRGQWERSCPVPEGNCSLMRVQAARVVTAPPLRTPARCPLLPPSPVFWVCPSVSSLELWWFSESWQRPCFCSPLVGPEVSSVLALHWAPSEAACAACPALASLCRPFPAWRPRAGWTLSLTRSSSLLCGAGGGAMARMLGGGRKKIVLNETFCFSHL